MTEAEQSKTSEDDNAPKSAAEVLAESKPTVLANPKFEVSHGTIMDIDPDDGTHTYHMGSQRYDCPNCPGEKHHWHDLYLELTGDAVIVATAYKFCRDCELETQGETGPVGSIESPTDAELSKVVNSAAGTSNRHERRALAAQNRKGKR